MTDVSMIITGRAVGASGEEKAFEDMVRVTIGRVAAHAHPTVRIGAEDAATIEVVVDRRLQSDVGEALAALLAEPSITSSVIGEEPPPSPESSPAERDPGVGPRGDQVGHDVEHNDRGRHDGDDADDHGQVEA